MSNLPLLALGSVLLIAAAAPKTTREPMVPLSKCFSGLNLSWPDQHYIPDRTDPQKT